MAIATQHLRTLLINPFQVKVKRVQALLPSLATRYPPLALLLGGLAALPGYGFLFLFPVLALVLAWSLPMLIYQTGSLADWTILVLSTCILLLCGGISWVIIRTPVRAPAGLELDHTMAPALFKLISELEAAYGRPVVDRIILRSRFEVQISRTPKYGMPFLTSNTLEIGLPVLLSLPPDHFKALLARRIGQIGSRHNSVSGWLYQLRSIWQQYQSSYAQQKTLPGRFLHAFFRLYTPFYLQASVFAARLDELEADRYALDVINDRDMARVISQEIVARDFLYSRYWPKLKQLMQRGADARYQPYGQMSAVIHKGINKEFVQQSLIRALQAPQQAGNPVPTLGRRLENMGFNKPGTPQVLTQSAARSYLEPRSLQLITQEFDQRWLQQQQRRIRRRSAP
ncbi:MAG: hypothetical protein LJE74_10540 [Proteobacteria bacterium]|jgi:hypothetical protein|nr:hypothetical protein [Pseudomonadota bacterium]